MMQFYSQLIDGKQLDQILFEKYFNKQNGFFIECGAGEGITESNCKFFEESLNWSGINVEASPFLFQKLIINRPKTININVALSNENKTNRRFYSSNQYAYHLGSLDSPTNYLTAAINYHNSKYDEYVINSITYKDLIQQYGIKSIDLFILDVEGHELNVIDGMFGCNVLPGIMPVEYGHCGYEKLNEKMISLGYKCDFKDSINVIFIKE